MNALIPKLIDTLMPIARPVVVVVWAVLTSICVPICAAQDFLLAFTRNPFTYEVWGDDQRIVDQNVADTAHTSLYFITEEGAQYLEEPERFDTTGSALDAEFRTTDGRRAFLTIQPAAHGGYRLNLRFEPDRGVLAVGEMLRAHAGERFHGLTGRAIGNDDDDARDPSAPVVLDRRGHFVEMELNGTIALYSPFYLSSRGYGVYVDGTWTGYFDMASRIGDRIQFEFDGPSLTYAVFLGEAPDEIISDYTSVVGRSLLPPRWAFGHHRWRDHQENPDTLFDGTRYRGPYNSMVYEDISMMEKLDIPYDVYGVERPWARGMYGYEDFEWDVKRFPKAEAMLEWLAEKDKKVLLRIAPWVMGSAADTALARGYFLPSKGIVEMGLTRAADSNDPNFLLTAKPAMERLVSELNSWLVSDLATTYLNRNVNGGNSEEVEEAREDLIAMIREGESPDELRNLLPVADRGCVLIDFTNPQAKAWWQKYIGKLVEQGVDAFKLDRSGEFVPSNRNVYAADGRSMAEVRNAYPVLYAEAVADVMREKRGDDFVVMPSAGYAGSQKHAVFRGGDTEASWVGLRNALIGGLRAGLMGYPFWGSDTGGYWGGTTTVELLARWLAVSAFSPIMGVGPIMNEAPWDMSDGTGYNEEAIAAWRTYVLLHKHLQDYTYEYAREAHQTGAPIMRPLFYEYPKDASAWELWDEFLYGEDYLVAPVLKEGAKKRDVYLPEGTWVDAWTPDRVVRGPATVTIDTPIYRTPIFVRSSASLKLPDLEALYQESLYIARQRPSPGDGSELLD